jgi:hypothetical protein
MLTVIMLSVIMLSVIMLSVIMLSVIMLSVTMLNAAPWRDTQLVNLLFGCHSGFVCSLPPPSG